MRQLAVVLLVPAVLFGGKLHAETVQELGLPSPAGREWIFASVTMGRLGPTEVEFCIDFVNPTPRTGYVEYAFFLPSGERPSFTQEGPPLPMSFVVTPWEDVKFCFNSPDRPLKTPEVFTGWAEVKASAGVLVSAQMKTRNRSGELKSEVDLFGNPSPVEQARFQLTGGDYGVTLVNPLEKAVEVKLSLGQGSPLDPPEAAVKTLVQTLSLAPRTQQSLLFGADSGDRGIFVELELVGERSGFGYTALGFGADRSGVIYLFFPLPYSMDPGRDIVGIEHSSGEWNLPVELQDTIVLGKKWIGTTGFGYYIREPGGSVSLFLEPGVESITEDRLHNVVFVNHYDGKQLILPEEGRMLALPQVGRVQTIMPLGGDLLEIESERLITGFLFLSLCRHVLVDLEALKVLQLFSYSPNPISSAGMNCRETPPWR